MTSRHFSVLCGVTLLFAITAGLIVAQRPVIESSDFDGTLAFPGLVEKVNELTTITIRHKEGSFTLQSTRDGWVFLERDNYPVQNEKIGELIVKLSRMEKVEPKTKLKERYGRLDLVDPSEDDESRAKKVMLVNSDGQTLAELLVGKRKFTLGSSEGGTYVLLRDDEQAWLVTGELNPGNRARDWLRREISDIKDDDIKRVTITHPDGEVLVVSKTDPTQNNYNVENIPSGMELRRDTIANDTGRVLSNLLLDDVRKYTSDDFPANDTISAIFEGFDGFTVRVDLVEDGDTNWVRFSGALTAPNTMAEGEGTVSENKDWNTIINELNELTSGWVFQLPGYEVSGIKKRMEDMIREPEADDA